MSKLDDILTYRLNETDRLLTKLGHMNQIEIVRGQGDKAKQQVKDLMLEIVENIVDDEFYAKTLREEVNKL